ncbi:MAG: adenylate/guanylate cyclase domain-containing protein [Bacteroides sp.]|nr:adenylate/guanylate cyclase domain-containing protein [Prevotella sp.]MCM1408544.1 adenylate/guanylate cyclase domain-containing protein [Treponema brennaborense]MCM1470742.1 adenylate/guanylate cyclase domain-containing protein [Bacteroides sp.]
MPKRKSLFQYVGGTPIIPISVKILTVFITLLLLSNFATNYLNILLNQTQTIKMTNEILVSRLKDVYTAASNQFQIYTFTRDRAEALAAVAAAAQRDFSLPSSIAAGVGTDGALEFFAANSGASAAENFDSEALSVLNGALTQGIKDGSVHFKTEKGNYLGVYKYHDDWQFFLIRGELVSDMKRSSNKVFLFISIIIIFITVLFLWAGILIFNCILQYIKQMTDSLYKMQQDQKLSFIDLSGAPNDDVTYLGVSFNSLSATINNLLEIFQKFVTKDVVKKAYSEHVINLEGSQRELTILFSDIRGFTYRTETLGNDIINLLNIHYDRAIHRIHAQNGIIGSIIGDALLAVYGTVGSAENKSLEAVRSAWLITEVAAELRKKMTERRAEIEKERSLTDAEERVFQAVMIDVGVGIDGGNVFYGNIGSTERMTNTVIGDNVNSASRLEGLTRVYNLPVIVSEYVKNEVEQTADRYRFFEIDTVQVKGKTEGKRIYFPLDTKTADAALLKAFEAYEPALAAYYEGNWSAARRLFKVCELPQAQIFLGRMGQAKAPEHWSGIWTMETK